MAKISVEVPDAWIDEDNRVYGVWAEEGTRSAVMEKMNDALAGWDYPCRVTDSSDCSLMWIDPLTLASEDRWPHRYTSNEYISGWVRLLWVNAEELEWV